VIGRKVEDIETPARKEIARQINKGFPSSEAKAED
jgi:hypothetical protein